MEFVIALLSIITCGLLAKNWFLAKRDEQIERKIEENEIQDKLVELSARRLKIKNDIDRKSIYELVNRKRDGDGDNS